MSLQRAQDDLAYTTSELEKHRQLNERLESDLLKIEQHGQHQSSPGNGDANSADAEEDDILAGLGLELGPATKSVRWPDYFPFLILTPAVGRKILRYKPSLYHLPPPPIHPFFPLSPASATASVNAMLNLKRYACADVGACI